MRLMNDTLLPASKHRKSRKKKSGLWENARSIGFAIALALIFRSLLFEPFHIPSGSMRSTLLEGDYIFISKYSYGYSRYSFPLGVMFDYFDGRTSGSLPERGDVVVFRLPNNPKIDYIKRVMALPGDTIRVSGGRVYLNEQMLAYDRIEDFTYRESANQSSTVARYRETLPNGVAHAVLDANRFGQVDNTSIYTVPEGHVFVMGDNRDHSIDSRYQEDVGFVPIENLLGRAEMILLSANMANDAPFWQFWHWLRPNRFVQEIQ